MLTTVLVRGRVIVPVTKEKTEARGLVGLPKATREVSGGDRLWTEPTDASDLA